MKNVFSVAATLGMASAVQAHMEMSDPPPFRSSHNEHTTDVDYSMTSPLDPDGSDFPCKGYHELMGTDQGASVADWTPGESYTISLEGSARHNGGSCQASLSYDEGESWTAIHSWIGECPLTDEWTFTLPEDAESGEAIFAWTWFNNVGNREMYMNCAHVTIEEGGGSADTDFSDRPAMFEANIGDGCSTVEGSDVEFPDPGPDVDDAGSDTGEPTGSCGGSSSKKTKRNNAQSFRA